MLRRRRACSANSKQRTESLDECVSSHSCSHRVEVFDTDSTKTYLLVSLLARGVVLLSAGHGSLNS